MHLGKLRLIGVGHEPHRACARDVDARLMYNNYYVASPFCSAMTPESTIGFTEKMLSEMLSCNNDRGSRLVAIRRVLADRGVVRALDGAKVSWLHRSYSLL